MKGIISFGIPGALELIIVGVLAILPIVLIVWGIKSLIQNKRENLRLRLEVGKLADELEQTRKQGAVNQ